MSHDDNSEHEALSRKVNKSPTMSSVGLICNVMCIESRGKTGDVTYDEKS